MIETIKNLPQPALIAICIGVYIIIAVIFTFVAGLITDDDAFEFLGMFWIVAIPIMVVFGVLWFFIVIFKFANKKPWRNVKRKNEDVN